MFEDCEEMDARPQHHKKMPYRVSARQFAIGFEEEYTDEIEQPANFQFRHGREFMAAEYDYRCWAYGDYHVENRLQAFVLFVKHLK